MRVMRIVLGTLALATPLGGSAQALSGAWDVTWAQAVRFERDGSMEIQRWAEAGLVLQQEGDRITGTWTENVLEEVRWTVEGTLSGGLLTLRSTGHDSENGDLEIVEERLWRAQVSGDTLEGETRMVIRGRPDVVRWRPWSARRLPNPGETR